MVQLAASWRSAVNWWRKLSWRSLRFPTLFLVSVALLIVMYRLRSDRIDQEEAEKALLVTKTYVIEQKSTRSHGHPSSSLPTTPSYPPRPSPLWPDEADLSEVASHERWVVVSAAEDEAQGPRRAPLSGAAVAACSVAAAAKARGWRPIVIGEALKCCRLPDCVPLDAELVARLPYRVLRFLPNITSSTAPVGHHPDITPLRNAAFLFAIQHGARYVFDAYPPSGGDRRSQAAWAEEVFSSMTLGATVGLVLDGYSHAFPTSVPGAPSPRVLNPYAHFGRPDLWARGYEVRGPGVDHHVYDGQHLRYRVCEIRKPSVEMFLDVWDGGSADVVAPPVTVPVNVLAPHGSRNVLYTRDALWGLALLPDRRQSSQQGPQISPHLARSLWNHALLGVSSDAGGVRFTLLPQATGINSSALLSPESIASLDISITDDNETIATTPKDPAAYIATFTSRVLRWRCRCTTLLPCLSQMASDFLATSILTNEDAAMLDAWVTDLRRVRYLPPPVLPWAPRPPPRPSGPCVHPPHHHHRQSHDPPLPHPTTLTFHPIASDLLSSSSERSVTSNSLRKLIARFHRDAALLEWSSSEERTREELSLVEETLAEDHMLTKEGDEEISSRAKVREDNLSRKNESLVEIQADEAADGEEDGEFDQDEDPTGPPEDVSPSPAPIRSFLGDVADHICPGFAPLVSPPGQQPPRPSPLGLEHILLVVWFPRPPRYDLLPTLELIRSHHFPNALFCGPPHRALPSMLSRFETRSTPSFLTATSRSDCLLTALEMGYRVGEEGSVLLVEESALPIPWMLSKRNRSLVWFHKDEGRSKRGTDTKVWDVHQHHHIARTGLWSLKTFQKGTEESIIMAAEGLASALRFVARVMGMRPNHNLHPHHLHPMEDIDHDDAPWGKISTDEARVVSNVTETSSVPSGNDMITSSAPPMSEATDIMENLTEVELESTEQPQQTEVDTTDTKKDDEHEEKTKNEESTEQVEKIVEEVTPSHDAFPLVEHVETPSVEYSEPVLPAYGKIEILESQKPDIASEITEIKSISNDSNSDLILERFPSVAYNYSSPVETFPSIAYNSSSPIERLPSLAYNSSSLIERFPSTAYNSSQPIERFPSTAYNSSPSVVQVSTSDDDVGIDLVLDTHLIAQENSTKVAETLGKELEEAVADAMSGESKIFTEKQVDMPVTEWPLNENSTSLPWDDDDVRFEVPSNLSQSDWVIGSEAESPSNLSLSDWVTSSGAEDILSSITMIENASENNTDLPDIGGVKKDNGEEDMVTEYMVDDQVNVTHVLNSEVSNTTLQQTFEFKSAELYEDEVNSEEAQPTVNGEVSLGEGLLSYKDVVGDSPQFISTLSSSNTKTRAVEETAEAVVEGAERDVRRRKRESGFDGVGVESLKDKDHQPTRALREPQDQEDERGSPLGEMDPRLKQSLEEIEELFSELAREFPEDTDAVLREGGNPNVMQYSSGHYGLDHTDFRHLHCDYRDDEQEEIEEGDDGVVDPGQDEVGDWSRQLHFEPCVALRRFFLRLHYSHQSAASMLKLLRLATTRGSAPVFHLPLRLQRELHLSASLLLSQGFPEEAVLPLLVYGLAGENGWVNLKKGRFVDDRVEGVFPTLNTEADFLHPTNLRTVADDPRMRSVFCLKFLLRVLDG